MKDYWTTERTQMLAVTQGGNLVVHEAWTIYFNGEPIATGFDKDGCELGWLAQAANRSMARGEGWPPDRYSKETEQ